MLQITGRNFGATGPKNEKLAYTQTASLQTSNFRKIRPKLPEQHVVRLEAFQLTI